VRFPVKPWHLAAVVVVVCAAVVAALYLHRMRGGASATDLVSYLPADATQVYIDVDAIRRSGILNMLAGSKATEEVDYKQFVDATLFDYRQDLEAVAASFKDGQVFLALRGHFHWKNVMDYAVHQGGSCHNGFCVMAGSRPNRRISFYALKPNVMAMAVSPDDFAAYQVSRKSRKPAFTPPAQPIWAIVPVLALEKAGSLPDGVKPYVAALGNAEQALFALGGEGDHLQLTVDVACRDSQAASTLLVSLEDATNTLRKRIASEHRAADASDLSGVLVAGSFRRDDRRVYGQWPIARAFVDAVAGGAL